MPGNECAYIFPSTVFRSDCVLGSKNASSFVCQHMISVMLAIFNLLRPNFLIEGMQERMCIFLHHEKLHFAIRSSEQF